MPLLALPVALPPDVVEVRAGDVDADGRDELVCVVRVPGSARVPDGVRLVVFDVADDGAVSRGAAVSLGTRAMLWDIQGGLWAVDGDGALELTGQGEVRIGGGRSALAGLGPTTPVAADIAHDLDGDGTAEVMVFDGSGVSVSGADGASWGRLPVPGRGQLSAQGRPGGTSYGATVQSPTLSVGDFDGDGLADILRVEGERLVVAHTGPKQVNVRSQTVALPLDLEPDDAPGVPDPDATRYELERAWLSDLDGDGRVDFAAHRWVVDGSWFGATAELWFAPGTGTGFGTPQRIRTEHAAVEVQHTDFDGDGDQDVLVAQVDFGMGNLGRALLSQTVRVDVTLFAMADGRYPETPVTLRRLDFPVDRADTVGVEFRHDVTGDGIADLVTNDMGQQVRVYAGHVTGLAEAPTAEVAVTVPRADDPLFVHDLTGDGRAEVLVWAPGDTAATLVMWR